MSIAVVNLEDNRPVLRIFIALLIFLFDPPSYKDVEINSKNSSHQLVMSVERANNKFLQNFSPKRPNQLLTFPNFY
jgi:hypothetical protein